MNKNQLRITYKQKRAALSAADRMKLDDLMLIQLQRVSIGNNTGALLTYYPVEDHAEPNMHLYTRYIQHAVPHVQVAYPVIDFATAQMQAFIVHDETHFIMNSFGIYEPAKGEAIAPEDVDIAFVPLLVFDKKGYRVGFGKGFYDRFLKQCRDDIVTIGFSYFDGVDSIDDRNQYDVPLTHCVTPHRVYEF